MNDIMKTYDNYLVEMRGEFVDEAEDNLDKVERIIEDVRNGKETSENAILQIRRHTHSLKGSSGVAEFPIVTILMHRLEDYLSSITELSEQNIKDIFVYIDKAREFSSVDVDQDAVTSADIVRTLPVKKHDGEKNITHTDLNLEALLIITDKIAGLIFERELKMEGLRVTTIRGSFDGIEMAIRTHPDIVVVSGVLDVLSGVDVVSALKAMPISSKIPVFLLTSFEKTHNELSALPRGVPLIQKSNMREDFTKALKDNNLI